MKRVLALLLCLLCAMFLLVACGGESDTDNQEHVHTFKTNEEWTKDAQNHWYDATCDCEDVVVTKLNHTDANNDGACDVCGFTNHEHEYSEEWTADCTNHWNAADCGHTVAGINVSAHEDKDADGICDVCKYVIEDLHEHIYSNEWSNGDGYHWYSAICEHKAEIKDKGTCTVNDAGVCTVCDARLKEIDLTDLLAVLKAAVANNYKVVSGNVYAMENAYEGTTAETGKTDEVFFVLGNGESYIKWVTYNKSNSFLGVDQYWFQTLSNNEIFGVQMPYYDPNEGTRNTQLQLFPVSGDADKLSGYTYLPGTILAKYDNNTTLSQTLFDLYDIMVIGTNVLDSKSNYDEKTGKYTFSYNYYAVNETEGNTEQDGSGEAIVSYYVEYYEVSVMFTVNSDLIVNYAEFSINSYRGLEGVDEDLTYDPETNTVTLLVGADPTVYEYSVSQTSGKRVYTSIYTKESLLPTDFELSYVTKYEDTSNGTIILEEVPLVDTDGDGIVDLVLDKETYTRLHVGEILPKSANANFMSAADLNVTYVNILGNGRPWGSPEFFRAPGFDPYMNCVTFRTQDSGTYLITIKFGQVEKKISLVVSGEPAIVAPDDTDDTKYVLVTETDSWVDEYTFTAKESGTYTFTLPLGLGFKFEDANEPEYAESEEKSFSFDLAKGYSVSFAVSAKEKGVYAIGVSFEAKEVESEKINIIGTYVGTNIKVVIDETTVKFIRGENELIANYEIIAGKVKLYNQTTGDEMSSTAVGINLSDEKVVSVVYEAKTIKVRNENEQIVVDETKETLNLLETTIGSVTYKFYTDMFELLYLLNISGNDYNMYFTYELVENADATYTVNITRYEKDGDRFNQTALDYILADEIKLKKDNDAWEMIFKPNGTKERPYIIENVGDYSANAKDLVWYVFTATETGYITVVSDYATPMLQIGTDVNAMKSNKHNNVVYNTISINVTSGETVYIAVGDTNLAEATVNFTVLQETEATEKQLIIGNNEFYCKNETLLYTATENLTLNFVHSEVFDGELSVTISINNGEFKDLFIIVDNNKANVSLKAGDKLVIEVKVTGYTTITVSETKQAPVLPPDEF